MTNNNEIFLLKKAEAEFLNGDYKSALQTYGRVLEKNPKLDEAKVGIYLSDIGTENEEEAQSLFDYYQAIKNKEPEAAQIVHEIIDSIDVTKNTLSELMNEQLKYQAEYEDGILYSDFKELIENRGSFKSAFEDIMFSTKVIITEKEDFIDFIKNLAQEGFEKMALEYLDSSAQIFGSDQEVLELYSLFKKAK
jgi:tetratricopeptide (TPR) repeat protein